MILIYYVIYVVCPLSIHSRPLTDSSSTPSWLDLIFAISGKEENGVENNHEHSPMTVTPLLHPEFCGTRPGFSDTPRRIVGGASAGPGEVPWQANIAKSDAGGQGHVPVCGASVVTSRAVLTAAHCLKLPASSYRVLVGRTSLVTSDYGAQVLEVKGYSLHPNFNSRTLDSDLAVVEVTSEYGQGIHFTPSVLPACLPLGPVPDLYRPGTMGFVSGFGVLSETSNSLSNSLQTVSLPVINHVRCEESYKKITNIGPSQFCAGLEDNAFIRDACSGDSGGPMAVMEDGKWFLTGLVSFGMGCGRTEYPGVYTRLDVMTTWITERLMEIEREDRFRYVPTTTTAFPASSEPLVVYKVSALCPGAVKYIWCNFGSEIRILETKYGRQTEDINTCRGNQIYQGIFGDCSLSTAFTELSSSCDSQRTCKVSTDMFSNNPCQRRGPYLKFKFVCQNPIERSFDWNFNDHESMEFP